MAVNLPIISTFDPKGINQAKTAFGKLGSTVKNLAIAGAVTAATTAVAGLSTALRSGFGRLRDIENARNLLQGIGNDAKTVQIVMDNALSAVKGTAFGLGEAAQTAATAVAAGIQPGQELAKYLSLVADAATVAGVPLEQMGATLNKVTTIGKAQNDTLRVLAEQGIPVYQYLAEELDTTAEAVFDLAKEGEISAEILQRALENNLAGAALKAGETVEGAFANIEAALSRLGAAFLGPTFEQLPNVFQQIIDQLDLQTDAVSESGDRFGEAFQPIAQAFVDVIGPVIDALIPLIDILSILLKELVPPFIEFVGFLAEVFGVLFAALQPLIESVLPVLVELFTEMIDPLMPLVDEIMPLLVEIISALAPLLVTLIEAFMPLIELVMPVLVEVLRGLVIPLLEFMAELLGTHLVSAVNDFAYWMAEHAPFIANVVTAIGIAFTQLGSVVFSVINFVLGAIEMMANAVIAFINSTISSINKIRAAVNKEPLQLVAEVSLGRLAMPEFGDIAQSLIGGNSSRLLPAPYSGAIGNQGFTFYRQAPPGMGAIQNQGFNFSRSMTIPAFAEGGIVTGPTLGLIGEAGPEAVIPLNQAGMMGNTYNITVNTGVGDPVRIGEEVVNYVRRYERASGKVFASA